MVFKPATTHIIKLMYNQQVLAININKDDKLTTE